MAETTPNAPETTDLSELLSWLRGMAAGTITGEMIADSLSAALYYEAQAMLQSLAPEGDPDFFSEAAQRQTNEAAIDWAQRTLEGLVMNLGEEQGAQVAARGAQRATGLLEKMS